MTLRGKISLFVTTLVMCIAARLWWSIMLPVTQVPVWMLWMFTLVPFLLIGLWGGYLYLRARRSLRLATALLDLCARQVGLIKLTAPKRFVKPD